MSQSCVVCGEPAADSCGICNEPICQSHSRKTLGNQYTVCTGIHNYGKYSRLAVSTGMEFLNICSRLSLDAEAILDLANKNFVEFSQYRLELNDRQNFTRD